MISTNKVKEVLTNIEKDLAKAEKRSKAKWLDEHEYGYAEGVIDTLQAMQRLLNAVDTESESWEEVPPVPSADGEWGDVPPARTGMGS